MGPRALSDLGVSEAEIVRLRRVADRLVRGAATRPHGTSPQRLRAGRGLEFFELRAWSPGDEMRDVDWRATARSPRPVVRRYQDEALATVLVCLDGSASMAAGAGAKWDLARRLAAAVVYLCSHAGHEVGLVAFSDGLDLACPPARGRAGQVRLLARLAELAPRTSGGASRLDACGHFVEPGTSVVVVSDFLTPDFMRPGLERLLHRGGRVQAFQVLAPDELGVPDADAAVLVDVETGVRRTVRVTAAARKAARRRLDELCAALGAWCRHRGVPLTACTSDTAWRDVVLSHVRTLGHA
jgi:uncharacterized protein (DUF58 family)